MILDGRKIAGDIKQRHTAEVKKLPHLPKLAIVYDANDPAQLAYLKAKQAYGRDIGAEVELHAVLPTSLVATIQTLNADPSITGIIVQLPLPAGVDADQILDLISPTKDVDGLSANSPFDPATPRGIMDLLAGYNLKVKGQAVVVVGQGRLVGLPLVKILKTAGAKVLTADEHTTDLQGATLKADILITATGQPGLIKPGMVKPGTVIIDAGSPKPEVDPTLLADPNLKITPVPGGVGPMTVAALFDNLLAAYNSSN